MQQFIYNALFQWVQKRSNKSLNGLWFNAEFIQAGPNVFVTCQDFQATTIPQGRLVFYLDAVQNPKQE